MSTIHFNQTTTLTPEQYIAGLTDFGSGRSEVFSKSADDYLKVHSVGPAEADVTEGSGGVWERLHYDWSDPSRVVLRTTDSNVWGGSSGYTYTVKRLPHGATDVDVVIVREGENAKGRLLGRVLGSRQGRPRQGVSQQHQGDRGAQRRGAGDERRHRLSRENAPAPALVAKRLLEAALDHGLGPRYARLLNNLTHWGFGLVAGAGYGLVLGSRRDPRVWSGLPFGATVGAGGHVVLPLLGVYEPIWKYDLKTLAKDLGAHLVSGTATAAAFRLLAHGAVDK